MKRLFRTSAALVMAFAPVPALAQQLSDKDHPQDREPAGAGGSVRPDGDAIEEILVLGSRARGAVEGNLAPVIQLDAGDIRATGAGSLADLLQELAPQIRSGGGRGGEAPVVLINGKRVSGFAELRNIPPEAIERVDILPEEVSLSYGFRADQRVINFVLLEQFRSVTAAVELGGPAAGGRTEVELGANALRLSGKSRLILDLEYEQRSRLLESSRAILPVQPRRPFDLRGNIVPAAGQSEIDPALSNLAGMPVTVAGVPGSAAAQAPGLDAFLAGANVPNRTDEGTERSLLPETRQVALGGSLARPVADRVQATLSARLELSDSKAWLGLPAATLPLPANNPFSPFGTETQLLRLSDAQGPLLRSTKAWTGRIAAVLNGDLAGWRWTFTASHDHTAIETLTDRGIDLTDVRARIIAGDPALNPFGKAVLVGPLLQDRANSKSDLTTFDMVLNGRLLDLPAGGLAATLKGGYEYRALASETMQSGVAAGADLQRGLARMQASFDVPIASRNRDVLGWLGTLSVNINMSADALSDFGTLASIGAGLNWAPVEALRLSAALTQEDGAPSFQQLGDPVIVTPNVRVFDYVTGETVEITRVDGGNTDLSADRRRVLKIGANWKPLAGLGLDLSANYVDSRIDSPIASLPAASAQIEAAFPERFVRGPDGRLLRIDSRPVNFLRSDRRELRSGISFFQRLAPSRAERAAMEKRRAAMAQGRGVAVAQGPSVPRPPPGLRPAAGGGRRGGPEARLQLSLFHTWRLEESILVREGIPRLDLLDGSAIGSRGGVSRHAIEGRAGVNRNGLGARLALNWQSGTMVRVDPSAGQSPDDLFFSSLATVNLRLSADLGQQPSRMLSQPWARGVRLSIGVDNLFDSRLRVQNRAGLEPLAYQPDLLDPVGRRIEVSVRKIFL